MARKLETKIPKSKKTGVGKHLFHLRSQMGWTQEQLAWQFGVTTDTIVKWEMGTRNMSGPALKLLEIYRAKTKMAHQNEI